MATRRVFAKYEEIVDLNTIGGTISVIGIHTPTGDTPRKMFPGFFQQYKKYKYLGCSVVARNAAQLPVDPLGLGYEAGEGQGEVMDPRDVFDPIMFHGCHGQDLGTILNKLYNGETALQDLTDSLTGFIEDSESDSDNGRSELLEGLYYKALTDMTWKKFGIQTGFSLRGLHPLVYSLATNHQISPSMKGAGVQIINGVPTVVDGIADIDTVGGENVTAMDWQLFTPRCQRLGWLDTRVPYVPSASGLKDYDYEDWQNFIKSGQNYATLPKIFMGVLLLPMSRRVQQFLRIVITHKFEFAGFRGASFDGNVLGSPSMFEMGFNEFGPTDSQDAGMLGGAPDPDPEPEPEPTPEGLSTLAVTVTDYGGSPRAYQIKMTYDQVTIGTGVANLDGSTPHTFVFNQTAFPVGGLEAGKTITLVAEKNGTDVSTHTITVPSDTLSLSIYLVYNGSYVWSDSA